ncbi:MAG: hemolysin III family protein [Bdellovibrionaceae bacterium]|nr:hemolysin III family protein [Pseudobdellovibrionaceae bacterium]
MQKLSSKPTLRGYLHQEAFFVALGACSLLIVRSSNTTAVYASIVYSLALLLLFGFSAFYHRRHWEPKMRSLLKRVDHSAIFVLIAGTTTPIALLALRGSASHDLTWIIWAAACVGIAQSVFWVSAPKWVTALLCVAAGWLSFPYMDMLKESLTPNEVILLVAGGLVYTIGAIFYAIKKPNFFPNIFGYHELFHLFTIIAAALHFVVIYNLVSRA